MIMQKGKKERKEEELCSLSNARLFNAVCRGDGWFICFAASLTTVMQSSHIWWSAGGWWHTMCFELWIFPLLPTPRPLSLVCACVIITFCFCFCQWQQRPSVCLCLHDLCFLGEHVLFSCRFSLQFLVCESICVHLMLWTCIICLDVVVFYAPYTDIS